MNAVAEILSELNAQNVRPVVEGGKLKLRGPAERVTPDLVERVRADKAELLSMLADPNPPPEPVDASLALLHRLRGYTILSGRMPAARAIANCLCPFLSMPEIEPVVVLAALQAVEMALRQMGGEYDADLANAIWLVNSAFPGAGLVEVRRKLQ